MASSQQESFASPELFASANRQQEKAKHYEPARKPHKKGNYSGSTKGNGQAITPGNAL